jgi:hypothetical protein
MTGMGQLTYDAPIFTDSDVDDAMAYEQEMARNSQHDEQMIESPPDEDEDLEAMFASYQVQQSPSAAPPVYVSSPSSNDEYDELFAELIANEGATGQNARLQQFNHHRTSSHSNLMDEDSDMMM